MSKIVKIGRGEASLSEVVTYGLKKRINAALFKGKNIDLQSGVANVAWDNVEEAQNVGILGILERLTIDGADKPIEMATLEALMADEYQAISEAATAILNPPDQSKKKTN